MLKNSKYLFLLITVLSVAGQAAAQPDGLNGLQVKFDAYRSRTVTEKLFVHTDKPSYLAGEICWLKIYCVDGRTHTPLELSKVAYVEILDKDDHFVLQGKIALEAAEGKGSFFLPLTLNSGNYRLRAYTNWMKNSGPDYFFEAPLTIINTLKELPAPGAAAATRSSGGGTASNDPASGSAAGTTPSDSKPVLYKIGFFPEGGNLITEVPTRIAFRVTDRNGIGADCKGYITDERKDTVGSFLPLRFGIGSFLFTASAGHRYQAWLSFPDGETLSKELPTANDQGYAMRVEEGSNDKLKVTVHARGASSRELILFGQSRSSVRCLLRATLAQDSALFLIDKGSLGEGINQLTLFDAGLRPLGERLYFKRPAGQLSIGLASDQPGYGTRQKVSLSLDVPGTEAAPAATGGATLAGKAIPGAGGQGGGASASLSLSVYRDDSLTTPPQDLDIDNYWWLSSDLRGRIESPDYYFSASGPAADQALDNLMLTHGWRRFRWENILQDKQPALQYPPEFNGQLITGRLTDEHTGAPIRGRLCFFSVPGIQFRFQTSKADSAGRVYFDIKDFYGPQGFIVQSGTENDSLCKVDIFSPFSEQYSAERLPVFSLSPAQRQSLHDRNIAMQVQNIYSGDSLQKFRAALMDTFRFYGKSDYTYMLDDYVRFTTMEEVLREYVREINVNHEHGRLHVVMLNEPHHEFFDDDNTLVLLDGVPVTRDKIFSYDPLKVKRLDVVPREYFQGPAAFSGIASFTTYKGDYEGLELDPRSVLVDYEGLQWQREFYAPEYTTEQQTASRLPDFRDLLFWEPGIHTEGGEKKQFSFYTSDLPGKYRVVVQGMTADGRAGSKTMSFEVK
ncbi:MAG TPA: hypothetical protein VK563_21910 [Puia sp.]|nr:hypothetical protein [Puia sp.]